MFHPIQPARLERNAEGIPFSSAFGDVYHSAAGALGQARHVFLAGNDLPRRWQGRDRFVVLETGFGLGLNFLATWQAWQADPTRCDRLHFVSCEKHPFTVHDLAALHAAWPELAPRAEALRAHWPPLVPGFHRLHLAEGRVTLTLLFGDAKDTLAELDARVDAFFLDGFSPACNPELWSPRIFHRLARLAAPGATLATWSVAGDMRASLAHAGFAVEKTEGYAGKRQMLRGQIQRASVAAELAGPGRAIVLGAGLAGTALAHRLTERGWQVDLVDAGSGPGKGASGNLTGVLRPLPSLDDNRIARLTRAGTIFGIHHLRRLAEAGHPARWDACGVLHLARDAVQETKQQRVVDALQAPPDFLRFVDREEASRIAGWPLAIGGWWFPHAGWVAPRSLCAANLAAGGDRLTCRFGESVARIERTADLWRLIDPAGAEIFSAPVLILASGTGITAFPEAAALPVVSARGQVSHLRAAAGSPPGVVVCRQGYVTPAIDGWRCAGATFQVGDLDPTLRDSDHAENLAKLAVMLPGHADTSPSPPLGRVGFRPASPDRLPMVGAVPMAPQPDASAQLGALPRQPGLYTVSGFGARGLVWSSLMGEWLASHLCGDPLPFEHTLSAAIDPARFLLRPARPSIGEE